MRVIRKIVLLTSSGDDLQLIHIMFSVGTSKPSKFISHPYPTDSGSSGFCWNAGLHIFDWIGPFTMFG